MAFPYKIANHHALHTNQANILINYITLMKKFLLTLAGAVLSFCASAAAVTVDASQLTVPGLTTADGYTIDIERATGSTTPAINAASGALRVYANNTVTVSGENMSKIVFKLNTASLGAQYAAFTPSVGELEQPQAAGDSVITWVGSAESVTFTVGAKADYGTSPTKAGQVHILAISIEDDTTVAPDPIEPDPIEPDPVDPELPGGYAISMDALNIPGETTIDGFDINIDKALGASAPSTSEYEGLTTLRVYANNTVTVSGENLNRIVFKLNTSTGARRYADFVPSVGELTQPQAMGDSTITWVGLANSVTFTVGAKAEYGTDGSSKAGQVHIDLITVYTDSTATPDVPVDPTPEKGTQENPYTVTEVIALNPASTTTAVASGVYVGGYIVGYIPTSTTSSALSNAVFGAEEAATTNIVLAADSTCTDFSQCIGVQLPVGDVRNALSLALNPTNLGRNVLLKGDVMKYCGGPGLKNTAEYVFLSEPTSPDVPDVPVDPIEPDTTGVAHTIAAANLFVPGETKFEGYAIDIQKTTGTTAPQVYGGEVLRLYANNTLVVSGPNISKIEFTLSSTAAARYTDFTPSVGTISPAQAAGDSIITWVGKADEVSFLVGAKAVYGTDGDTKAGQIHIDAITIYGDSTAVEPVIPVEPIEGYEIAAADLNVEGDVTIDGFTVAIDKAAGSSAPIYNEGTAAVRLYANNTITVAGKELTAVMFTLSSDAYLRYTDMIPSVGEITPAQAPGDSIFIWRGKADAVTFTVGEIATLGTENTKNGQIRFTKLTIEGEGVTVEHGTKDAPYSVTEIIDLNNTVAATGVWTYGYIVGVVDGMTLAADSKFTADSVTTASNILLAATPDCTDYTQCVPVQLPVGAVRAALNLVDNPDNLGKDVLIKGDLAKYFAAAGIKSVTEYEIIGAEVPVDPVDPDKGTESDPYTVSEALQVIAAGNIGDRVYVQGTIVSITEVSTSFGNATYAIADAEGGETLGIYRGYWLNGEKFTAEDQIKVGAEVVVYGVLMNYLGNTPQFNTGSFIISYKAPEGGDTPEPVDPVEGEYTINANELTVPGASEVKGFSFDLNQGEGPTAPVFHESSSTIRLYADNTLTVSGENLTQIVFVLNAATQAARYTEIVPSVGEITPAQAAGDSIITWIGDAASVTFTVGHEAILGTDGETKRGQIHFTKLLINGTPGEGSGEEPVDPVDPVDPVEGEYTINANELTVPGASEVKGFSFDLNQGEGPTAPVFHESSSTIRLYADNTLTVSGENLTQIVFVLNAATQAARYTEIVPSVGEITPAQAAGDSIITWIGDAASVTFTVGHEAILGTDGETKRGQIHFTKLLINGTPGEGSGEEPVDPVDPSEGTFVPATSIESGKQYVLAADGKVATSLGAKNYGYLSMAAATFVDGYCKTSVDNAFTFTAEGSAYYMQDAEGNYYYQTGTYNSFNKAAEAPAEGALWTIDVDADGVATITNTSVGKTISYAPAYTSYGSYAELGNNILPTLYLLTSTTGVDEVEAASEEPVEYYNLQGVRVINPEAGLYIRRQGNKVTKVLVK